MKTTRAFSFTAGAASLMLAFCVSQPAQAEDAWVYEFTPYLWATRMQGDVQSGRLPEAHLDMSFGDILEDLDFGLMGSFEARHGRWGLLIDAIYMKISQSAEVHGRLPGPIAASGSADADASVKQNLLAAAIAYRLTELPDAIDILAGLRYNRIYAETRLNASLFGLSGSIKASDHESWLDPYVGLRYQNALSTNWTFVGYADIGGFGIGSNLTWQGLVGLRYTCSDSLSAIFGFRHMKTDYDQDGLQYDVQDSGPYLGVTLRY